MADILNQIDDTLAWISSCGYCRTPIGAMGPSQDFCGEICQLAWHERHRRDRSGSEEESVPAEVAPACRGCRRPAVSRPVQRDGLCCFCLATPRCTYTRTNELDGRHMACIRPLGHQPPCEEGAPGGSQWVAASPTEEVRNGELTAAEVPREPIGAPPASNIMIPVAWHDTASDNARHTSFMRPWVSDPFSFEQDAFAFRSNWARFGNRYRPVDVEPDAPHVDAASEPQPLAVGGVVETSGFALVAEDGGCTVPWWRRLLGGGTR